MGGLKDKDKRLRNQKARLAGGRLELVLSWRVWPGCEWCQQLGRGMHGKVSGQELHSSQPLQKGREKQSGSCLEGIKDTSFNSQLGGGGVGETAAREQKPKGGHGRNKSVNSQGSRVGREPVPSTAFDTKKQLFLGSSEIPASFITTQIPTINCLHVVELAWVSDPHNLGSPLSPTSARLCVEGAETLVLPLRIPQPDANHPQTIITQVRPRPQTRWNLVYALEVLERGVKIKVRRRGQGEQREGYFLGK